MQLLSLTILFLIRLDLYIISFGKSFGLFITFNHHSLATAIDLYNCALSTCGQHIPYNRTGYQQHAYQYAEQQYHFLHFDLLGLSCFCNFVLFHIKVQRF